MYSKSIIDNDLGKNEFYVWSKVNHGIDPSQWASLCRAIGELSPREFSGVVALVNAHNSLKNALVGHTKGLLGIGDEEQEESSLNSEVDRQEMPLLSVGPSGVGGEFQREIRMGAGGEQEILSEHNSTNAILTMG